MEADRSREGRGAPRPRPAGRWIALFVTVAVIAAVASAALSLAHRGTASGRGAPTGAPAVAGSAPRLKPSAAGVSAPPLPGPWRQVFADDFSAGPISTNRWVTCYDWNQDGCTNAGNHEFEWYTPGQVQVADGAARLTAERRPTKGVGGKVYPWTSGMLSTGRSSWYAEPRFTFTYGFVEAAIRMPAANGIFPAFWLLTANETTRPEIDIVEMIGSHTNAFMNLHWTVASGQGAEDPAFYGPVDFSSGYHDFAVDWEPDHLTWYVDGVVRYSIAARSIVPAVPMELIFTLAVGVPAAPAADLATASMSIDWVRIWQHTS